jgi:tungstate transport system substrate-binding protein
MLAVVTGCGEKGSPRERVLRLATTTTTRDTGLLDVLIPPFEQAAGVRVDLIVVGTGEALKLGRAGDVDAVLAHSRTAEDAFMADGEGSRREDVMVSTFEILGPPDDPAGIREMEPAAALQRIAAGRFPFASRGDDSGTHQRELWLWEKGGGRQEWPEHLETGLGMGATLTIADQTQAYVLCDRGTFLYSKPKIELVSLVRGSEDLRNPYGAMVVNPENHPAVRTDLAHAFLDYLISAQTQTAIRDYQIDGESLFYPLRLSNHK